MASYVFEIFLYINFKNVHIKKWKPVQDDFISEFRIYFPVT